MVWGWPCVILLLGTFAVIAESSGHAKHHKQKSTRLHHHHHQSHESVERDTERHRISRSQRQPAIVELGAPNIPAHYQNRHQAVVYRHQHEASPPALSRRSPPSPSLPTTVSLLNEDLDSAAARVSSAQASEDESDFEQPVSDDDLVPSPGYKRRVLSRPAPPPGELPAAVEAEVANVDDSHSHAEAYRVSSQRQQQLEDSLKTLSEAWKAAEEAMITVADREKEVEGNARLQQESRQRLRLLDQPKPEGAKPQNDQSSSEFETRSSQYLPRSQSPSQSVSAAVWDSKTHRHRAKSESSNAKSETYPVEREAARRQGNDSDKPHAMDTSYPASSRRQDSVLPDSNSLMRREPQRRQSQKFHATYQDSDRDAAAPSSSASGIGGDADVDVDGGEFSYSDGPETDVYPSKKSSIDKIGDSTLARQQERNRLQSSPAEDASSSELQPESVPPQRLMTSSELPQQPQQQQEDSTDDRAVGVEQPTALDDSDVDVDDDEEDDAPPTPQPKKSAGKTGVFAKVMDLDDGDHADKSVRSDLMKMKKNDDGDMVMSKDQNDGDDDAESRDA
mmetsp:Transcript_15962/g.34546  ORF Transcript_15962/g.34546 Transcript_15962/m.34546 type:complete len:563 (+) Transcript_15962:165-1853(+)